MTVTDLKCLRPLMNPLRGMACFSCSKPRSRWVFDGLSDENIYMCSLCVLYKSEWARANARTVDAVVSKMLESKEMMVEGGELVLVDDADSVLGVLVLSDRVSSVHKMVDTWK